MGCDIHAYIEYFDASVLVKAKNSTVQAHSFSSEINLGRNYTLFSIMAGVRGTSMPVVNPRGIPDYPTLGFDARSAYYAEVIDGESSKYSFSRNCYSRESANILVQENRTSYVDENNSMIIEPSWHTPSWLNTNELIKVRKEYLIEAIEYNYEMKGKRRRDALNILNSSSEIELMQHVFGDVECATLNACIGSMIALERSGDYKARLVFWFDS
mgnify:CR=1 FL=1